jgi:hypothetical protein
MGRACSTHEREAECIQSLSAKENRSVGRPRHRYEDNIKMDIREIGWDRMDWIHLARDRDQWKAIVNTAMSLWGFMLFLSR